MALSADQNPFTNPTVTRYSQFSISGNNEIGYIYFLSTLDIQIHRPKQRKRGYRCRSCAGSNRPSSQLTVWTCSQTSRRHTCPQSLAVPRKICHLVAFQTRVGGDVQVALGTGGLTNSAGTTVHLLLTSGDEPSHVDTRG